MSRYRYRAYCRECNESSDLLAEDTSEWEAAHDAKHDRGRCSKCAHWRDRHIATDAAMREYLRSDQTLVCYQGMGMGDFCGCAGDA